MYKKDWPINGCRELLIKDGLPPLETNLLNSIRKDYFEQSQKDCKTIDYEDFTARVIDSVPESIR